jgi:hypothetical protein
MKNKNLNPFLLCICAVLFLVAAVDINGRWAGVADFNGSSFPISYDFKTDGGKVTGTMNTPVGTGEIKDGKVENDNISFKVDLTGTTISHTGKITADSISMVADYNGAMIETTLKRKK